jgi:hypothetical protein
MAMLVGVVASLHVADANALPDGREWEMVSPVEKNGGLIVESAEGGFTTHASVRGDAVSYVASKPVEPPSPEGFDGWAWVLSSRGPSGWFSRDLTPPYEEPTGSFARGAYEFPAFSKDLARAVLMPPRELTERVPYLRTDYFNGDVSEACVSECFEPLVWTGNVPPGTFPVGQNVEYLDASGDALHVLLNSKVALTAQPLEAGSSPEGFYEWSAGVLSLVSVLEDGKETPALDGFISPDGSRVVWRPAETPRYLYLRDVAKSETLRLDASQGGASGQEPKAVFAGADASWSRLLFTDPARLTADSTAIDTSSASESDLYVYDLNRPIGSRLTDLSIDPHFSEHANVSTVLGAFDEGTNVYFVAPGALATGAVAGNDNVYVAHYNATGWETPSFLTMLPSDASRTTMSHDGRYLLFSSSQQVTAYNNHDAASGQPDPEIYMYDVQAKKLVCVSCNPSEALPTAGASLPPNGRFLLDDGRVFFQAREALVLGDVNGQSDVYEYEPAGIGDCTSAGVTFSAGSEGCVSLISTGTGVEGASFLEAGETGEDVFFLTSEKVLSRDGDTTPDIYDAHRCTASLPCLPPPPVLPPECFTGDSCKGALSAQPAIYGAPASATFSGHGNLTQSGAAPVVRSKPLTRAQKLARALRACRKKKQRSRAACQRRARRLYGGRPAPKATARKGGKR